MDVWKYEIISRVEQDTSACLHKFYISAHPSIIPYLNLFMYVYIGGFCLGET